MAQFSVRIDDDLKRSAELVCEELGLSMSAAINIYLKKLTREKRIPFDVAVDPFYSDANMKHLEKALAALNRGEGKFHELIEE